MARKFKTPITLDELGSASSQALAANVDGDSQNRINIDAGGKITWGSGSATGDTTLYRSAADTLKTDDAFTATSLAVTGQFTFPTSDGSADQVITTNGSGTLTWSDVSANATVSDTAPSSPATGQIWYESDTGKTFVYYDSAWVEVGASPPASPFITDLDEDTKIQVEESADEDKIRFDTAGSERMIIDNTGNVGIGTTSPSKELDVHGASNPEIRILSTDASDPALVFGDSVDGARASIYYDTSDNRLIFRGYDNANRMTIDSSGNVGIGTATPDNKLHVVGKGAFTDAIVTGASTTTVEPWSASTIALGNYGSVGTQGSYELSLAWNWDRDSGSTYTSHNVNSYTSAAGIHLGNSGIKFQTEATWSGTAQPPVRMLIDPSGNVGIGTTAPSQTLDVRSANDNTSVFQHITNGSDARIELRAPEAGGTSRAGQVFFDPDANFVGFRNGNINAMGVDSSGNVGIGTTAPAADLHIADTAALLHLQDTNGTVGGSMSSMIQFTDSTGAVQAQVGLGTGTGYFLVDNNDGPMRVGTASADSLYLRTNNANQLTINSSGNVGIGTTSPSRPLDVAIGGANFDGYVTINSYLSILRAGGSGNTLVVQNSSPVGSGVVRGAQIELGPDGNEDYTDSGDDFLRFITSNNQEIGSIRGTGAASVSYGTTSDYRLKTPIAEIEDGLTKVRQLAPMYGKWIGQNDPDRVYSYFIAHELQEHIPDAVNGEKDEVDEEGNPEYQSVDYGKLTPTLVAAIKDLDALVGALTSRIEALEAN